MGSGEFVIMGLLPYLARDIGISEPQAGHLISAYALGVVVGAPLVAIFSARHPRRGVLLALLGFFMLANGASALASTHTSLLITRFVAGLPHGAYFGLAALVAASMVPESHRARAVGYVMMGLTMSTLLGLPISAWMGQTLGWRPAFAVVTLIAMLSWLMVLRFVPDVPSSALVSPQGELSALRQPQVWLTLGIGVIGCGGMFAVVSYIVPLLSKVTMLSDHWIPPALAMFGLGMAAGNTLGAYFADKALMKTIAALLVFNIAVSVSLPLTAPHPAFALTSLFFVGTFAVMAVALQTRLMDVAREGQALAAALNHAAFNMANAIGALLGGIAISMGQSISAIGYAAAMLGLGGFMIFSISVWLDLKTRFAN
jgi:DHA1 family inner membrane transport protein